MCRDSEKNSIRLQSIKINIVHFAFNNKRLISKIVLLQMAYGNEVLVSRQWIPNIACPDVAYHQIASFSIQSSPVEQPLKHTNWLVN